jgi:hypothetical protein
VALLYALYDDQENAKQFYSTAVMKFPNDATIWFCVAVFANNHGYSVTAKDAITKARVLGDTDASAYSKIMSGQPYSISLAQVK